MKTIASISIFLAGVSAAIATAMAMPNAYIPIPAESYPLSYIYFNRGKVGTVFDGKSQIGLTIGQLLRRQAKF